MWVALPIVHQGQAKLKKGTSPTGRRSFGVAKSDAADVEGVVLPPRARWKLRTPSPMTISAMTASTIQERSPSSSKNPVVGILLEHGMFAASGLSFVREQASADGQFQPESS